MKRSKDRFFEICREEGLDNVDTLELLWQREQEEEEDVSDSLLRALLRLCMEIAINDRARKTARWN